MSILRLLVSYLNIFHVCPSFLSKISIFFQYK
jgi:hypothetical protein